MARMSRLLAVSALGLHSWGPPNSVAQDHAKVSPDRRGDHDLFSPKFSCCDESVIVAPGVGIISTVPSHAGDDRFGEMTGTSMASPIACGTIAALLSRAGAREGRTPKERVDAVSKIVDECRSVGLRPNLQGKGLPFLS